MEPAVTHDMAVEARSVTKPFGGDGDEVTALDDVTVSIRENEFFTLLAPLGRDPVRQRRYVPSIRRGWRVGRALCP